MRYHCWDTHKDVSIQFLHQRDFSRIGLRMSAKLINLIHLRKLGKYRVIIRCRCLCSLNVIVASDIIVALCLVTRRDAIIV